MTPFRILACGFLIALGSDLVLGFSVNPAISTYTSRGSALTMYPTKASPTKAAPPSKVVHNMIPNPISISPTANKKKMRRNRKRYNTELSNSVLADCNTLPSFPTAHGILSPETVMRMEEMVEAQGQTSAAVDQFLKQYRRQGPMSCLSMLSDPEVLPHLTKAMRDVV